MNWLVLEPSHRVKTRKAHICDGCGRSWPASTRMETWTGRWFGEAPVRVYLCLVCNRFWRRRTDIEFDRDIPYRDPAGYVKTEAKLALYVVEAGVEPMASQLEVWR